jgi:DNA-binding LacI/PurR family transcriptional regulator
VSPEKQTRSINSTSALARYLGLSRWTISRVLNGHTEVKPETCQRVRSAMVELGFVPSPLGRALRGGRTGLIGICFQALGSPIVARKIATLQRILREAGFRALCELTDGHPDLELEVIRNFVAMKVDGIMLVGGLTEANASVITTLLARQRVAAVLIDPLQRFPLPTVELDREEAMRIALHHLLTLGHDRFGMLGIDESVRYGLIRWRGIRRFAVDQQLDLARQFVRFSEPDPPALDFAYGGRLAEQFLAVPVAQRPTALVALNDQVAIGAMSRLHQGGVAVPQDVSLLGFDNLDVSAHVTPRLTTVDQLVEHMMQTAVDLLAAQTAGSVATEPTPRVIVPQLVARDSTGRAPAPGVPR